MAMSDAETALSPISFTFAYAGNGWADAAISDGETTYSMYPSYVPTDPFALGFSAASETRCEGVSH